MLSAFTKRIAKNKSIDVYSLQQKEKVNLLLLPISLLSLPPPLWKKKSWRVFLAFSFSAARWKSWPYPALLARTSFFIFSLCLFLPSRSPISPMGRSHYFHFFHTFTCLPDSFPAPLTTARSSKHSHNPACWRCGAAVKTQNYAAMLALGKHSDSRAAERFHATNSQPTHFQHATYYHISQLFPGALRKTLLTISSEFLEAVDLLLGSG